MWHAVSSLREKRRSRFGLAALIGSLAFLRLAHIHLLWADEDYHLASALFLLNGKVPYRDYWYDKPPLTALYYLLIGATTGWPLRVLDAIFVLASCYLAFRFAKAWWGEREGWIAAILLAFYTAFYHPSAVVAFAPDAIMLLPHLAAMLFAYQRRNFWAGLLCGVAFLANPKALFVLAACAIWTWPFAIASIADLLFGFAIPIAAGALWAVLSGAWDGYVQQVWAWGFLYTRESPAVHPFQLGLERTTGWAAFHAALLAGAIIAIRNMPGRDRFRLVSWLVISLLAVCVGTRFFPRYYLQLLPVLVLAGSRGIALACARHRIAGIASLAILLSIPAIRFGARTASLFWDDILDRDPKWSDVSLDLDSRRVAGKILPLSHRQDTLFVWGYRSDIYVYTRLIADGLFWDSQPLTGVLADRHLSASQVTYSAAAASNRLLFVKSRPTFFVDGLGLLNPRLKPEAYPEVRRWLQNYELVGRTDLSLIYRRRN